MNHLRRLFILLLFANIGALAWWHWHPDEVLYSKPVTDPGTPGLILHQEFLQLENNKLPLQALNCWLIGPYASELDMLNAYKSLEYIALDMQHSKAIKAVSQGYQLTIPPSADAKQAQGIMQKLKNSGIDDVNIYEQGPLALALSLGQFERLEDAQALQKQVQDMGYEVELKAMQSELPEWWIKATLRNTMGFEQWQLEQKPRVPVSICE